MSKIDFFGDPVTYSPAGKVFAKGVGPDVALSVAAALFVVAASSVCGVAEPLSAAVVVGACAAGWNFLVRRGAEKLGWRIFSEQRYSPQMCINTKPDANTQPSKPEWLAFAEVARWGHRFLFFCGLGGLAHTAYLFGTTSGAEVIQPIVAGAVDFVALARVASGTHRWTQVLNHKWVVQDKGPSPEGAPPRDKVKRLFGVPDPSPASAG